MYSYDNKLFLFVRGKFFIDAFSLSYNLYNGCFLYDMTRMLCSFNFDDFVVKTKKTFVFISHIKKK